MSIFQNSRYFLLFLFAGLFLTGCVNKETPEEQIYKKLEEVVSLEKGFEDQQDPLVDLERKEKELYDKIIGLGMKEYEQIVSLSDEALENVEKRKEHMDEEQESMNESRNHFKKVKPLFKELENKEEKQKANVLYETMIERYKIHDELYANYSKGLQYDRELYELLTKEDVTIEQLEKQINKINEIYEKVLASNETFNKQTKKYNELKLAFYKEADIKVEGDNIK